jgi:hypothetical protein
MGQHGSNNKASDEFKKYSDDEIDMMVKQAKGAAKRKLQTEQKARQTRPSRRTKDNKTPKSNKGKGNNNNSSGNDDDSSTPRTNTATTPPERATRVPATTGPA